MERRSAVELRVTGSKNSPRISGYAAVFDSASEGLPFTEFVRKGAFRRSLESNSQDVLALVHHRPEIILGRRGAGTLGLQEDSKGLRFDLALPDTTAGRDLAVSVERGDIAGASFAFTVPEDGERWSERGGEIVRELLDVDLHDISITASPAYPDTSVAMRSLDVWKQTQRPRLARLSRFLETC